MSFESEWHYKVADICYGVNQNQAERSKWEYVLWVQWKVAIYPPKFLRDHFHHGCYTEWRESWLARQFNKQNNNKVPSIPMNISIIHGHNPSKTQLKKKQMIPNEKSINQSIFKINVDVALIGNKDLFGFEMLENENSPRTYSVIVESDDAVRHALLEIEPKLFIFAFGILVSMQLMTCDLPFLFFSLPCLALPCLALPFLPLNRHCWCFKRKAC